MAKSTEKIVITNIMNVINAFLKKYKGKCDGYGCAIEGTVYAGSRSTLKWHGSCQEEMTVKEVMNVGSKPYDDIAKCIPDTKAYKNFVVELVPEYPSTERSWDQEVNFCRSFTSYYITNPDKIEL